MRICQINQKSINFQNNKSLLKERLDKIDFIYYYDFLKSNLIFYG